MNYEERLKNVTVLGAAGKMGSGILLLIAMEMADLQQKSGNHNKVFTINAIDTSAQALKGLQGYLKTQVKKIAEKRIVQLRKIYYENTELIENWEIIDQYVEDVLKNVQFTQHIGSAYESGLIFEAILEDADLKKRILSDIIKNNTNSPWVMTNTSSVPISELEEVHGLNGKIIGFHFYNPPAVQKLVELITTSKTENELIEFSKIFAKNLKKTLVPANDFAGFIGNGHFMRDLLFGIQMAEQLTVRMSWPEAIYSVNRITRDFLIRPMGIFQLMDYVGIDVCQNILKVMRTRLKDESLHSDLIDILIPTGIKGGQNPDGSQKPGIFTYADGRPVSLYDTVENKYKEINSFKTRPDNFLGQLPSSHKPWKDVISDKKKDDFLFQYFTGLKELKTEGSEMALRYLDNSLKSGLELVKKGVAYNHEDVNTVMLTGFFHAYGPINNFLGK
jgi:3-hydroxyacyl-CoA dehydrogenase